MNIIQLNEYLQGDYDKIEELLNKTGFYNISTNRSKNEIRCAREYGHNATSVSVNVNNLYSKCYSTNIKGNLITLIQKRNKWNFGETLRTVSEILNIDNITFMNQNQLPFGGYYKKIFNEQDVNYIELPTYDEKILDNYHIKPSALFYKDGINYNVQEKYKIGYDRETDRIVVAWRDTNGKIIGIMGRYNSTKVPEEISRWMPIIPFSKSYTLFGFSENYTNIVEEDCVIILESEKAPMQLESYGINYGLGLGGSHISLTQESFIKSLNVRTVILAYDEGIEEEFAREQALKLVVDTPFVKNKVGYIYDAENHYLKNGMKQSPSDLQLGDFNALIQNKIRWVNK